jgi:AraC family transcriptional regulator, positive regulator of tynA and feaB
MTTEAMMRQSDNLLSTRQLHYEAWRDLLRSRCGRYNAEGIEPDAFAAWVRCLSVCGFTAFNIGSNAERIERTYRDVRLDSVDHYLVLFQVTGQSAMNHNDQVVRLAVSDIALVDSTRPVTYFVNNGGRGAETERCSYGPTLQRLSSTLPLGSALVLILPRQSLVSHLGFDPEGGSCRRAGTLAGRLLFELIRNFDQGEGPAFAPTDAYMQLAVIDLVGALFAPSDPWPVSRHADKLFMRMRGIITDRFTDPDFGPCELAVEAGISLRYAQKLFAERGSSVSQFVYSFRLDYAARLVQRRASLGTSQPLSEIAYACGFRDYTLFARKFRQRFGDAPGAYAAGIGRTSNGPSNGTVRTGTGQSALSVLDD